MKCAKILNVLVVTKRILSGVAHVQKAVFVLVFVIDDAHELICGWDVIAAKKKKSRLFRQLHALSDDVNKRTHSTVSWHQELVLVNSWGTSGVVVLFHNHGDTIGILGPYTRRLLFSQVQWVLLKGVKHVFFLHFYKRLCVLACNTCP